MKFISLTQLVFLALLGSFLSIWSCRREVVIPLPAIVGKPSAATTGCMFVGAPGSMTLTMRLDIYVVDRNGRQVAGLSNTNFTIPTVSGRTYQLTSVSSDNLAAKPGGYSAMLLLDQSGSILTSDPNDLRIQASKIFLDYLGASDVAALASFPGTYDYFHLHSGFTRDTKRMKSSLDTLSYTEGGGTPLYEATMDATDYTARYGATTNKAVIIFTDGQSSGALDATIQNAQQKGIPLYTVGLSSGINVNVLARMASETCGAFFYAKDAEQLITSFGTLGNLLRGSAKVYRTNWSIVRNSGTWRTGDIITNTLKVTIPNSEAIEVPFWLTIK